MHNRMISKINNDEITQIQVEDLLLSNREILNNLILENTQKKDKSFVSMRELEIIKDYEANLLKLLESCPPNLVKTLMDETSDLSGEQAKSVRSNKDEETEQEDNMPNDK